MMTLKECFQYANYLSRLLATANRYLCDTKFTMNRKEIHKRAKAVGEAIPDETILESKDQFCGVTPMQMVDLVQEIVSEMDTLQDVIDEAKSGTGFDKLVMINSKKRDALANYEDMAKLKPSTNVICGTDYKFNAEGNQSPYRYEVEVQTSIDFDRNQIRNLIRKLRKECDDTSAKIDEIQLNKVDFTPKYSIGDDVFDILVTD